MAKVCVVGAGEAGLSAARRAVENGSEVVLVERSSLVLPRGRWVEFIDRPVLAEKAPTDPSVGAEWELIRAEALSISPGDVLTSSGHVRADTVVVTSGVSPVPPRLAGVSKPNVYVLSSAGAFAALGRGSPSSSRPAVLGSMIEALRVAERVSGSGRRTTVFVGPGAGRLAPEVESVLLEAAASRGIDVRHADVQLAAGVGRLEALISEGEVFTCDLLAVVPFLVPFLPASMALRGPEGGALVNQSLLSSMGGVYAAGGCAELRSSSRRSALPLQPFPESSGRVAGENASGGIAHFSSFVARSSRVLGLRVVSAGLGLSESREAGLDAAEVRLRLEATSACSIVYEKVGGRVLGVQEVGPPDIVSAQEAFLAVSEGADLKSLACGGVESSTDISLVEEAARQGIRGWSAS